MTTKNKRISGFTLVEIMIVVAIISLLAVIAIPNFVRARTTTQQNACINNLRQIYSVKQQWALEYKLGAQAEPTPAEVSTYLKNPLVCPGGGAGATFETSYIMNVVGVKPTCKIMSQHHVLPEDSDSQ
jgi:prepilin-type N-terminal cleavage/methylation domain-containing protein